VNAHNGEMRWKGETIDCTTGADILIERLFLRNLRHLDIMLFGTVRKGEIDNQTSADHLVN
jgi:hypothetical protein